MNKTNLIAIAAEKAGIPKKDAERFLNAVLETTAAALEEGEKVVLSGFGAFEVKERQARKGRNPKTNEAVTIPASKSPVFKASAALKERVAK